MLQRSDESGKEPSFGLCFKLFVSTHIPDLAPYKTGFYTLLLFTTPISILDQGPHTAIHLISKFQNETRTSNARVIIAVVPRRLIILQQPSVVCTKIFFLEGYRGQVHSTPCRLSLNDLRTILCQLKASTPINKAHQGIQLTFSLNVPIHCWKLMPWSARSSTKSVCAHNFKLGSPSSRMTYRCGTMMLPTPRDL